MNNQTEKQIIVLKEKQKKPLTRPQKIAKNILLAAVMVAIILAMRSGTFTQQQAYENQLKDLGITENSFINGTVKVISDDVVADEEDADELWEWGYNYEQNHYDFEPERVVTLESSIGGEPVHVRILLGKRMLLWHDAACMIEYVNPENGHNVSLEESSFYLP